MTAWMSLGMVSFKNPLNRVLSAREPDSKYVGLRGFLPVITGETPTAVGAPVRAALGRALLGVATARSARQYPSRVGLAS